MFIEECDDITTGAVKVNSSGSEDSVVPFSRNRHVPGSPDTIGHIESCRYIRQADAGSATKNVYCIPR